MFFLRDLPSKQMVKGYAAHYAPDAEEPIKDALIMMRRASILVRELNNYFSENELSQLKFLILIVIDRESDRDYLSYTQLSHRLDVSKPVVTRTVGSLLKSGWLEEKIDPDDARSKQLKLTAKAKTKLNLLLPGYFKILVKHMRVSPSSF